MAAITICSDFGAQKNKVSHCFHCFPIYLPWSDGAKMPWSLFSECWVSSQPFHSPLAPSSRDSLVLLCFLPSGRYHLYILRLLIFLPTVLILACGSATQYLHFSSVQSLSSVWLFANPWTSTCQASLSVTKSQSLLKLMSIELVMPIPWFCSNLSTLNYFSRFLTYQISSPFSSLSHELSSYKQVRQLYPLNIFSGSFLVKVSGSVPVCSFKAFQDWALICLFSFLTHYACLCPCTCHSALLTLPWICHSNLSAVSFGHIIRHVGLNPCPLP